MRTSAAAAAVLFAAACHSTKPAPPLAPKVPLADAAVRKDAKVARAEAAWARRAADPAALDQAIELWEDAALTSADPAAPLLEAARARRERIERARRGPSPEAALIAADAQVCAADAHRSWAAQFPAAAAQLDGTREAAAVYQQIGATAAEALYLEAVCAAAWARMQGFTQLIERRLELTASFQRVAALLPELDGAGAEREQGTLFAALPSYAGGDLAEARRHLDFAVQRAPQDPRNHLALARTVAVKAQDRALFEQQLALLVHGDDPLPAAEAAALLQREDELFGPAEAAQPVPGGTQR